jgi:hypothetical protein
MSNAAPADGSTTDVEIVSNQPNTQASATAAYASKDTTNSTLTGTSGSATIPFAISRATPGYQVNVTVTVGAATCSTSFTPVA